ncbi:hypothetical protein [Prescottella agglutinans]|uniref:Uncharacterized protein n=1 Tax=Prescottella agglutinans TaxID=1644129 RepID=A0ABT6MES2_9NOCA|nr:hypothetical protein [Prescottella agglutinans]MDH6282791.1 hypothetical protein [Prescottella agglutinans]
MPALQPLEYCKVIGRFVATVADGVDTDDFPDAVSLQGSVTFTPSLRSIKVATAQPDPATVLPTPITITLDENGYLSWRGKRGVFLVAPTGATNPVNWNYTVTFDLALGSQRLTYPPFAFDAPVYVPGSNPADPDAGSTVVDLTLAAPVYPSSGTPITLGPHIVSVSVVSDSLVFHLSDGSELPPIYLQVLHDISASVPVAVAARDDAVEAAGISVAAAEFADRRATNADESAIEAQFAAAEASEKVAQGLAGKADKNHTHDNKADLGADGKLVQAQIPAQQMVDWLGAVATQSAMLALSGQRGDWCTRTDLGTDWQLIAEPSTALASWRQHTYPASPVSSVAGRTGAVTLSRTDVGLGSVDNTKDVDKPVSTPQQAALTAQRDAINLELLGKAAKLVDRGNWVASTSYAIGDVVTASYVRWYCKTAHSAGATFSETNWILLGLAAVGAAADPGVAGRLWVKTS